MVEVKIKPKKEQQPSAILLKDLYKIVNDKSVSHEERKQALDQINQQLAEPSPSEQKPIEAIESLEKKTCLGCQCEFTPKEPEQKFHNRECYEKSRFLKTQLEKMHLARISKPKPQIIPKAKEPRYCVICGSESFSEYCQLCRELIQKLRVHKQFREKKSWAYVLINGVWIFQPLFLALHNQKNGCKIFTYEDYLKWRAKQNGLRP